jgi:hypothetical protein
MVARGARTRVVDERYAWTVRALMNAIQANA